ncbi:MAG TPA: ABC transporter permease [bacterium]|nr:ABC transporter permease [bacterium]
MTPRRASPHFIVGFALVAFVLAGVLYEAMWGGNATTRIAIEERLQPPTGAHVFGTDDLGRDLLARVLGGGAVAFEVGAVAVGIGLAAGVSLALVGLRWAGWPAAILAQLMNGLMAFPAILLALAIVAVLGTGYVQAMIAIGIVLVPVFWRQTRAQVLVVAGREFVEAARGLGATEGRILWRHVMPQVAPLLAIQATTTFSGAVLSEASLSFLGVGTQPPVPSWGRMLLEATRALGIAPWMAVFPGIALGIMVLGVNLLGDGLRDALDPQLRRVAGREPAL